MFFSKRACSVSSNSSRSLADNFFFVSTRSIAVLLDCYANPGAARTYPSRVCQVTHNTRECAVIKEFAQVFSINSNKEKRKWPALSRSSRVADLKSTVALRFQAQQSFAAC